MTQQTRTAARAGIPRTRAWGLGLAFVTACISGVAIFVNAHFVRQVGDATVYTTAKNGVAALVLLAALGLTTLRRGMRVAEHTPARRHLPALMAIGVIGGSVPFVLFFEGLARADSAAHAGFIHKTLVVWVVLLAVPWLRERFTLWHLAAIVLLLAGQVLLVDHLALLRLGTGERMVLLATLLWAIEFVLAKRLLASLGSLAVGTARLGIGIGILGVWVLATGRGGLLATLTAQQWTWAIITGFILAAFVASWYAALARAQAIDVTAVLVFGQVVTAVLSAAYAGVALRPDVTALALISVGTAFAAAGGVRAARVEVIEAQT